MKTKKELEKELEKIFEEARQSKIKIAVASDEEGNEYNLVGTTDNVLFGGTKKNAIVIAVDGYIEENKIFNKN